MKIILSLLFIFFSSYAQEDIKVVYDLSTGNLIKFEKNIIKGITINKAHYEGKFQDLHVSVVIHANAYKFFNKNSKKYNFPDDLKKRIAILADMYDVDFMICKAGMIREKIEDKDIFDFVTIIPNATIGLIDKQNEGFAYIPVRD
jgi:intracellular sulfur oxidation DsrE/DsrF family protein